MKLGGIVVNWVKLDRILMNWGELNELDALDEWIELDEIAELVDD